MSATSTRNTNTPTPNVSLGNATSPRPLSSHAGASSPQPPPSSTASSRLNQDQGPSKFRASMGVQPSSDSTRWGPSNSTTLNAGGAGGGLRGISPGRASTGGAGMNGFGTGGLSGNSMNQSQGVFHSAETEAIDRWFEDLQHYEATLEEMAAASLDTNFKEELSAIEQWFRVLSEAERTAALYSLLQSATQMQMRFFITVLQQMARSDPTQAALLSPANPNQLSLEAQMEQKMSTLGLKSPSSPMIRQFARSSLGPNTNPNTVANEAYLSPNPGETDHSMAAQSTLAAQRAKLKASSRTSAPANLLLGNSANGGMGLGVGGTGEGLKSPLWSKEETVRERSPSPRPKSTGSTGESQSTLNASNANSHSFLRSPALDSSFSAAENQLSPLVGGNWASMVNTPLVPMFGKNGETMEPGNYGGNSPNPNLDSLGQRLGNWQTQNQNQQQQSQTGGIVLDDVRKFRRSARVSGGALSGMYEGETIKENSPSSFQSSAATAQKRVQDQLQAVQQLKNMQQSALSLGLGSLPSPGLNGSASSQQQQQSSGAGGTSRVGSSGVLNSPGLQQTAMQAQQNWRLQNAPQLAQSSSSSSNNHNYSNGQQNQYGQSPNFNNNAGTDQFANIGLGTNLTLPSGLGSPSAQQQAQQQLASLIALQQQMMQQQQQLQTLAGLSPNAGGLGVGIGLGGLGMMGTGANLSPNMAALAGQMMSQQQQISPRLGGGNGGVGNNFGLGMGMGMGMSGIPSPRRSPRPHDRSPTSFAMTSHRSGNSSTASQLPSGSGSNPDEPLDFSLLGDTPAWLRSLRLHKYTPNFEGIGWKEMVKMTDEDLEKRGVSALGARRKLIKVFETVRSKTGMSDPSAPAMDPSTSTDSTSPRSSTNNNSNSNDNDNSQAEKEKDLNGDKVETN
ncbi:hypothetical protein JCM3765_006135 [Sporobolomyces pararoseus]